MNDLEIKEAIERGIKVWPDQIARPKGRGKQVEGKPRRLGLRLIGLWGCPAQAWKRAA
jgi:hypothetical protein